MKHTKEIETPKLYLSTSDGKWRTIYMGMPECKDYDTFENPLIIYHRIRQTLKWDNTNKIPIWNGDLGIFQTMDNFTKIIR